MTTRQSFREEIAALQRELLRMGVYVSEAIEKAVQSLAQLDTALARQVIAGDDLVDRMLIEIEKRSLQLFALQQPMAGDLRAIGTALKVVTDLERMADHATAIAKITLRLEGERPRELAQIPAMGQLVQAMAHEALEAYVTRDVARARAMIRMDDEIDRYYQELSDKLVSLMQQRPESVRQLTYLLLAAMYLERVGDHATNLGEWTIYMVTGERSQLNL